jgi:tRNA (adenine37-N6)-methyltransferase
MDIILQPIGYIRNSRSEPIDDHWSGIESTIELIDELPGECLDGIEEFSHLEIVYYFHRSENTVVGSEHPRENPAFPKVGIFAQRKKDRPNHLGITIVNMVKREGKTLLVKNLDALDGTPVLDIKPVFREFLAKGEVLQPEWVTIMMENYWNKR